MYYYGARWYDPVVGRFLQPDTIVPNPGNPQSLNRYTYVLNNPLKYTDPTGFFEEDELERWFGPNWRDIFARYRGWENLLRAAQLGDAVLLGGDPSNLMLGVFALQDNRLVIWSITNRASEAVTDSAQNADAETLALYRSKNANRAGGSSQTYFPGENINPISALSNGSDTYVLVGGAFVGPTEITLPHEWYRGARSHVNVAGYCAGFELDVANWVALGAGSLSVGKAVAKAVRAGSGVTGMARAMFTTVGGGVGLAILAVDLATMARWDTNYEVTNGPGSPMAVPAPVAPTRH